MRLVFLGSGAFGLPTLRFLDARHDLLAVVSQPDRPAGRKRKNTPTPVSEWAMAGSKMLLCPENVNDTEVVDSIRGLAPDALVVIAFGQKIGEPLLDGVPAFNLHASLLPAYRGAAPINRAMIDGCTETGVSVIELAQRMDAGNVHATRTLMIDPLETAGELHDRLAELGPEAVAEVLDAQAAVEHLRQRTDIDSDKIFLFGRSLGGAVAIAIAERMQRKGDAVDGSSGPGAKRDSVQEERAIHARGHGTIKGVILENTFTCIADMVMKVMPLLGPLVGRNRPLHFLLRNKWDSDRRIAQLTMPVLFIVGEQDELVPPAHMHRLHELLPETNGTDTCSNKTLIRIMDGKHMSTWISGKRTYWQAIQNFVSPPAAAQPF